MVNFRKIQSSWKLRIRRTGLTNTKFAELLGNHLTHLSALINLNRNATLEKIQEIEDLLAEHGQPFKPEYIEDATK